MAKEDVNNTVIMIAIIAIVAIVAIISLLSSKKEMGAEQTLYVVDEEGNLIGEAKGGNALGLKICAIYCNKLEGDDCITCCLNNYPPIGENLLDRFCKIK